MPSVRLFYNQIIIMETTMAKYGEIVALAELFMKLGKEVGEAKKPTERTRPPKKDDKKEEVDILALMEKKKREYLALKNFVDEQAKLNKPEEKKKEEKKDFLSERVIALFLVGITPPMWLFAYWLLTH